MLTDQATNMITLKNSTRLIDHVHSRKCGNVRRRWRTPLLAIEASGDADRKRHLQEQLSKGGA